ncbi:MAG: hypothetical protein K2N70_07710 [Helicobacter sp.]|nr:hypothetical protein [Helicobacter sp.]
MSCFGIAICQSPSVLWGRAFVFIVIASVRSDSGFCHCEDDRTKQSTVFECLLGILCLLIATLVILARNDTWNLVMLRRSRNISEVRL